MIKRTPAAAFLAATLLSACSSATTNPPPTPEVRQLAFAAVADSLIYVALPQAQWGIEVWDQGRNQPLYSHRPYVHFVPASNTKLVVTTVAMGMLGPEWRYSTPVFAMGVAGDSAPSALLVRGSGDPTWSARFYASDTAVLDAIADSVRAKGIRRINGDVIIDATVFTPEHIHSAWEIGDLPWYYAAPTAAFAIGEAATTMIATSGDSANSAVTVRFEPAPLTTPVATRIRVDTAGARMNLDVDYLAWPDTLLLYGSMAAKRADTSYIAQPDPEDYAARALVAALQRKGINVSGSVRIIRNPADAAQLPASRLLFTWQSPPLHRIVAGILKPSQNWIAEQLLKTLGYTQNLEGSWRSGLAVERRYLTTVVGLDSLAFSLSDGSGLSAQNVVSPNAFVRILEHARQAEWGRQYREALPFPGDTAGTLERRLKGLEQSVHAKTGSIANVNSLSGYVHTAFGRDITFSILTNASGRSSAQMRAGIDALVQAIARERNWE